MFKVYADVCYSWIFWMLVDAMEEIKLQYQIKRNWMGDPCAPKSCTWDGLNCVYSPDHPRIISV